MGGSLRQLAAAKVGAGGELRPLDSNNRVVVVLGPSSRSTTTQTPSMTVPCRLHQVRRPFRDQTWPLRTAKCPRIDVKSACSWPGLVDTTNAKGIRETPDVGHLDLLCEHRGEDVGPFPAVGFNPEVRHNAPARRGRRRWGQPEPARAGECDAQPISFAASGEAGAAVAA